MSNKMKSELNFKSLVLITIQLPFCTFYKFIYYILSKFSRFLFSYEPIQSIMEAWGAYFSPNLTPIDNMEYKYFAKFRNSETVKFRNSDIVKVCVSFICQLINGFDCLTNAWYLYFLIYNLFSFLFH